MAIAAPVVLPQGWYALARSEEDGCFEREFGITDRLCQKALTEALSRGGDFADLYFEHTVSNWLLPEDVKVNRALILFEAVQPPAGEMPVVLGPGVTGILLTRRLSWWTRASSPLTCSLDLKLLKM